jgi:hypothetical protein
MKEKHNDLVVIQGNLQNALYIIQPDCLAVGEGDRTETAMLDLQSAE